MWPQRSWGSVGSRAEADLVVEALMNHASLRANDRPMTAAGGSRHLKQTTVVKRPQADDGDLSTLDVEPEYQ